MSVRDNATRIMNAKVNPDVMPADLVVTADDVTVGELLKFYLRKWAEQGINEFQAMLRQAKSRNGSDRLFLNQSANELAARLEQAGSADERRELYGQFDDNAMIEVTEAILEDLSCCRDVARTLPRLIVALEKTKAGISINPQDLWNGAQAIEGIIELSRKRKAEFAAKPTAEIMRQLKSGFERSVAPEDEGGRERPMALHIMIANTDEDDPAAEILKERMIALREDRVQFWVKLQSDLTELATSLQQERTRS